MESGLVKEIVSGAEAKASPYRALVTFHRPEPG